MLYHIMLYGGPAQVRGLRRRQGGDLLEDPEDPAPQPEGHTYVCIYIYTYIHTCVCIHMYVCMNVYI